MPDWELRDLWDKARVELCKVRFFGDLAVAAFFEVAKPKERESKRLELLDAVLSGEGEQYHGWLEERRRAEPPRSFVDVPGSSCAWTATGECWSTLLTCTRCGSVTLTTRDAGANGNLAPTLLASRYLAYVESSLDRLVELFDLGRAAGSHQPRQPAAWDGEDVVEVGHAPGTKTLPAPENDLGRKSANGSRHKSDNDRIDRVENGIPGQDHDRPATDGWRELGPPDLRTPHASPSFHSGSSPSSQSIAS